MSGKQNRKNAGAWFAGFISLAFVNPAGTLYY
jgi:hypothetical protein